MVILELVIRGYLVEFTSRMGWYFASDELPVNMMVVKDAPAMILKAEKERDFVHFTSYQEW